MKLLNFIVLAFIVLCTVVSGQEKGFQRWTLPILNPNTLRCMRERPADMKFVYFDRDQKKCIYAEKINFEPDMTSHSKNVISCPASECP